MKELLRSRSGEWLFDYRIWRWTGCQVEELEHRDLAPPPNPKACAALHIERVIGRSERAGPRSVDELRSMAAERGVRTLLDHALELAHKLGFRRWATRTNINLRRRAAGGKWETVVGFYIMTSSSQVGLNGGIWHEKLGLGDRDLPGQPALKIVHQTASRSLHTVEDLTDLLHLFRAG